MSTCVLSVNWMKLTSCGDLAENSPFLHEFGARAVWMKDRRNSVIPFVLFTDIVQIHFTSSGVHRSGRTVTYATVVSSAQVSFWATLAQVRMSFWWKFKLYKNKIHVKMRPVPLALAVRCYIRSNIACNYQCGGASVVYGDDLGRFRFKVHRCMMKQYIKKSMNRHVREMLYL